MPLLTSSNRPTRLAFAGLLAHVVLAMCLVATAPGRSHAASSGNAVSRAQACAGCHTEEARAPLKAGPGFDHGTYGMPLTGVHAVVACESCHKLASTGEMQLSVGAADCAHCHMAAYLDATLPDHLKKGFSTECQTCHQPQGWTAAATGYDHDKAGFPLAEGHANRQCEDCHHGNYTTLANDCYGCHRYSTPGYDSATSPVHRLPEFGKSNVECLDCHYTTSWQPAKFAEPAATSLSTSPSFTHPGTFGMTGNHSTSVRQCDDCHHGSYTATNSACESCHLNSAPGYANPGPGNPAHNSTYFPYAQCTTCHAAATSYLTWQGGAYTHTTMQLTNAHAGRLCEDCHAGNYTTVQLVCADCHLNTPTGYANATNPPHMVPNFPVDNAACTGCHNTVAWQPSIWPANHSTTAFAASFTGAHTALACTDCHNASTWNVQGTGGNCYGCHAQVYATAVPPHDPSNFPQAGCTCHNTTTWLSATSFDHAAGGFPLNGSHSTTVRLCADCHNASTGGFVNTSKACEACHLNSSPGYVNTGPGLPMHNTTYFPYAQCTTCHAAAATGFVSWQGGTFTHSVMQLTNAHSGHACEDCHAGNYVSVAFSCIGCHQNPIGATPGYATATNPIHTPVNFPTTNAACTGCHSTIAWSPSLWPLNHSTTAFAAYYTGAHLAVACTSCHNAVTWTTLATGNNCYGCHLADYGAAVPPHDPTTYPIMGCACHNTTTWLNATSFDHASVGFSMTGMHALGARQCIDCHGVIGYTAHASDKDCITCHAAAYGANGVLLHTDPNFPSTTPACITCHAAANTSHVTWNNGVFANHTGVTTNFALAGAHTGFLCSDCHTAPTTDLKQYTCAASCHSGDPRFIGHANDACSGLMFSQVRATGTMTGCYTCHRQGRAAPAC